MPEATPINSLCDWFGLETFQRAGGTYLPMTSGAYPDEMAINKAPSAVSTALIRSAPRLPRLSMTTFAPALPTKPPTQKTEVSAAN